MPGKIKLSDADIHPHLRARMLQRGVTKEEIEQTLEKGKDAKGAKLGTYGKVLVFLYNKYWEGYCKLVGNEAMILTAKAVETKTISPGVHADFNKDGKLIGIEIIDVSEIMGKKIEFGLPEAALPRGS